MALASAARTAAVLAASALALTMLMGVRPTNAQSSFVQDGEAGFVVTDMDYALPADRTGACPRGLSTSPRFSDIDAAGARAGAQAGASAGAGQQAGRLEAFRRIGASGAACSNPVGSPEDPSFHTVEGANLPGDGLDLDGQASRANGRAAPGTCAHNDFRGPGGANIDNQFYRVVGCSPAFQPRPDGGLGSAMTSELRTGAWGVLIRLRGIDDIRNDDDVEVGFYAAADPIALSAAGAPVPNSTYAGMQDERFRAVTRGRIINGVLTTDPVDVRFKKSINGLLLDRPLRDARVRMTLSADGVLDGYLAGYTDVMDMFDLQYGFRTATRADGTPARGEAQGTAVGAALTVGHTCNGAYHALVAYADGHPDPATGRCTSISTQYRLRAIPAFVVDAETRSVNAQ